jgi:hypothetical protein
MDAIARQYRREHREFLATNRSDVYAALLRASRLDAYLTSIGETASERLEHPKTARRLNVPPASGPGGREPNW